jgi:hypothetical protein
LSPLPARLPLLGWELADPFRYGGLAAMALLSVLLVGRRKTAIKRGLLAGAIVWQILIWLFCTHLQSRFLLTMMIPAALLIGGQVDILTASRRRVLLAAAAIIVIIHTAVVARAYNDSTCGPGERFGFHPVAGRDDMVRQWYPFGREDPRRPPDARVLLVGESRPFYVPCRCFYNTVFDRSVWIDSLERDAPPRDVISRMRQAGITHIFVNWDELARLQKYYHYAPNLSRQSLARLQPAGLKKIGTTFPTSPAHSQTTGEKTGEDILELYELNP